jgi:hypothetical protein
MLISQQMAGMRPAADQQVNSRMAQLRAAFPEATSEAKWMAVLAAYGIDEQKLRKTLEEQVGLMLFIDARLRPTVRVSRAEAESYYNEKLLPEMKNKGAAPEPLARVQGQIWEILLQQKIDAQLNAWLANLRDQGQVHILQPAKETAQGTGADRRGMSFSVLERH